MSASPPLRPPLHTVVSAMVALLAGCAVGPDYHRPPVAVPTHYKAEIPAQTAAARPPDTWWTVFNDPMLDQLIQRVEVSNQNLAAANAAYMQAMAAVSEARAAFFPTFTASFQATRLNNGSRASASQTFGNGGVTVNAPGASGGSTLYSASANVSNWELDVWGRLRRSLENARETAHAQLADLASARLSAQAQLATAYLQLREADAESRLLSATVEAYARNLQITRNRYAVGTAPKTDVLQAETQWYSAQQQEVSVRLARAQLENSIAALIGEPASDFRIAERDTWQIPIPQVPPGLPSELLRRRPDVVAAEHQLAAANANIGVQEAAYFPQLTLTGTVGFVSSTLPHLLRASNRSASVGAGAAQTLFDFGLTRARIAQAEQAYDQALANWRETLLTAFQSVENDLVAAELDRKQADLLRSASEAADETERITLNEYKAGTVDYTTVVVAQTAALSARRALAQMTVSEQTNAVSLITSLGGGWTPAPR